MNRVKSYPGLANVNATGRAVLLLLVMLAGMALATGSAKAAVGSPATECQNAFGPGYVGYKVDPPKSGTYTDPATGFTVTVSMNPDRTFDYSANWPVNVVVKGGPDQGNLYWPPPPYTTPQANGTGLHAPVNPNNGQFYAVSHITFCWKTNGPPPHDTAQLKIEKTADKPVVFGGEKVVFTISVTNHGPAPAENTVITDNVPAGLTVNSADSPCTVAMQLVTCNIGTLGPNTTQSYSIHATADPLPPVSSIEDTLDISKVESHISLQPGQALTQQLTCGPNAIMTDAAVRIDNVDLNTGDFNSVEVRRLESINPGTYEADLKNHASGQAQVKFFGVCVNNQTWDGRQITVGPLLTKTLVIDEGINTLELTCPAGTTPVSPGFELNGTRGVLLESAPVGTTTRKFTFKTDTDNASVTVSMRCLDNRTSEVDGKSAELQFEPVTRKVTVGAGQVVSETLSCGVGYKGIVAGWEYPEHLVPLGNDPVPIARIFKIWNPSDKDLEATLHLLCLNLKTLSEGAKPRDFVNTAFVTSSTKPAPGSVLSDSATVTVKPGSPPPADPVIPPADPVVNPDSAPPLTPQIFGASIRGGVLTVLLNSYGKSGTVVVKTVGKGTLLARKRFGPAAGRSIRVRLKAPASRAIRSGKIKRLRVTVRSAGNRKTSTVRVRR